MLTARCSARCDVSPVHTIYAHTKSCSNVASVHCMQWLGDAFGVFGGIIWGEVVMMHAQKFPISMYFLRIPAH